MAKAEEYKICCALANAYIAKVSKKNPNRMLEDRRVISEAEILTLIAWELDRWVSENEDSDGFNFDDGMGRTIEIRYKEVKEE